MASSAVCNSEKAGARQAMLNAYAGFGRVSRVDYSPDKDPTRMVPSPSPFT